jgi:hypothetical protein
VERAYLLPTAPSQALEGVVEGDGLWASEFVTTQDVRLERPDGSSGYVAGGDPGDGPPLTTGDKGHWTLDHHVERLHENRRAQDGGRDILGGE